MVDHQRDLLNSLADKLETKYRIQTRRLFLNLADTGCLSPMLDAIAYTSCRLLVYNAAYSRIKKFTDSTSEDLDGYMGVNVNTPLRLVHAFTRSHADIQEEAKGIILMSSLAGLWGTGLLASYGASKAFNILLAESLNHELKSDNFDVMACVAGATATPAYLGTKPQYGLIRPALMAPGKVAEVALDTLGKKAICIPGWKNRLTYFVMTRIFSRKRTVALFNRTTTRMYPDV